MGPVTVKPLFWALQPLVIGMVVLWVVDLPAALNLPAYTGQLIAAILAGPLALRHAGVPATAAVAAPRAACLSLSRLGEPCRAFDSTHFWKRSISYPDVVRAFERRRPLVVA
jgi:hypothetical protein